jgi:uncharacterized protein (DUF952 family)
MVRIFKILPAADWDRAVAEGIYRGSPVDLADGFVHFSDEAQVEETAARHFAGQDGLVLAAFDPQAFGPALKWEPSRGGVLFPHLYLALDPRLAIWAKPLAWDGKRHVFPGKWRA